MLVRFANPDDVDWGIEHDPLVPAEVVRQKIPLDEIIVAEIDDQWVAYLRLE